MDSYQTTQGRLSQHIQDHFALTEKESVLILDDVLFNLEGMASDWVGKRGDACPPEWRPERICRAIATTAEHLGCDALALIAANLEQAANDNNGDPEVLRPLMEFLAGVREAMPPVPKQAPDG